MKSMAHGVTASPLCSFGRPCAWTSPNRPECQKKTRVLKSSLAYIIRPGRTRYSCEICRRNTMNLCVPKRVACPFSVSRAVEHQIPESGAAPVDCYGTQCTEELRLRNTDACPVRHITVFAPTRWPMLTRRTSRGEPGRRCEPTVTLPTIWSSKEIDRTIEKGRVLEMCRRLFSIACALALVSTADLGLRSAEACGLPDVINAARPVNIPADIAEKNNNSCGGTQSGTDCVLTRARNC